MIPFITLRTDWRLFVDLDDIEEMRRQIRLINNEVATVTYNMKLDGMVYSERQITVFKSVLQLAAIVDEILVQHEIERVHSKKRDM
jgi:hypothetical protein